MIVWRTAALAVVVLAMVTGCAAAGDRWSGEAVPIGSRLVVHEAVPVSSYDRRAHIQDGRAIGPGQINRFAAHCAIRQHKESGDEWMTEIEPGVFEVEAYGTRIGRQAEGGMGPLRLASLQPRRGSVSHVRYETRLRLRSPEQPRVDSMICAYDARFRSPHLGFEDIRETLAGVATLERPAAD